MGSIRLPNLNIKNKYMYYQNLMSYNLNFWYYYYFFFFLRQLFFYLFYEKILNFKFKSYFKLNFNYKNIIITGDLNIILNIKFIIIKLNLLNFFSTNYLFFNNKNLNFYLIKTKIKNIKLLKYKYKLKFNQLNNIYLKE